MDELNLEELDKAIAAAREDLDLLEHLRRSFGTTDVQEDLLDASARFADAAARVLRVFA